MTEIMENTQNEELVIPSDDIQNISQSNDEPKTPLEMVQKILENADKGFQLTFDAEKNEDFEYEDKYLEKINILFSEILTVYGEDILEILDSVSNTTCEIFENFKKAGDTLANIINNADEGFQITDENENEKIKTIHQLFGEILMLADVELRTFIPTPIRNAD